jgi:tRNA 2-thiouridine synthesizing protein B
VGGTDVKRIIFLLTKPPQSERARLCFQLIERSKNATLYLVGDGVYSLLGRSIEALPQGSVYACKEDMDARGVQLDETAVSLVNFYEQLVEEMMAGCDLVYAF